MFKEFIVIHKFHVTIISFKFNIRYIIRYIEDFNTLLHNLKKSVT